MIVVLLGPSGAGKSSQSELLAEREHVEWVYVGQLLRDKHDPDIDKALKAGHLVDDEIVNQVLANHLQALPRDKVVVLDGFPRHTSQAEWLMQFARELHNGLGAIIHLSLPEAIARERLLKRQRSDDTPESIDERLDDYREKVLPVVDFFKQADIEVNEVDGNRPVEAVFSDIDAILRRVHEEYVHES